MQIPLGCLNETVGSEIRADWTRIRPPTRELASNLSKKRNERVGITCYRRKTDVLRPVMARRGQSNNGMITQVIGEVLAEIVKSSAATHKTKLGWPFYSS